MLNVGQVQPLISARDLPAKQTRCAGVRAPSGGAWPAGQWAAQRQAEARGGLEYLLTVGAPAGVIMLFALVAFALGRQVLIATRSCWAERLPLLV